MSACPSRSAPVAIFALVVATLALSACSAVVTSGSDHQTDPGAPPSETDPEPDPDPATSPDAGPSCVDGALPASLPAVSGGPPIKSSNGPYHLLAWRLAPGGDDYLIFMLDRSHPSFDGIVDGTFEFDFDLPPVAPCDDSAQGGCVELAVDWDLTTGAHSAAYFVEAGSISLTVDAPPLPSSSCRQHDGDVAACDDRDGCSYYHCSEVCAAEPPDSAAALCRNGCTASCPMTGSSTELVFRDRDQPACTTVIPSLTF